MLEIQISMFETNMIILVNLISVSSTPTTFNYEHSFKKIKKNNEIQ